MKVTSLRYLDAKFHHPSLGASPPNRRKSICLPPELSLLLKRRSINKFMHRYSILWPELCWSVAAENLKNSQKYQRTVGYPSTSWASCDFTVQTMQSHIYGSGHTNVLLTSYPVVSVVVSVKSVRFKYF